MVHLVEGGRVQDQVPVWVFRLEQSGVQERTYKRSDAE